MVPICCRRGSGNLGRAVRALPGIKKMYLLRSGAAEPRVHTGPWHLISPRLSELHTVCSTTHSHFWPVPPLAVFISLNVWSASQHGRSIKASLDVSCRSDLVSLPLAVMPVPPLRFQPGPSPSVDANILIGRDTMPQPSTVHGEPTLAWRLPGTRVRRRPLSSSCTLAFLPDSSTPT